MKQQPSINIVWLKKDLRLNDHAPLQHAIAEQAPFILLHCFEPTVQQSPTWNHRHWWFIYHSLQEMKEKLNSLNIPLYSFYTEVVPFFKKINEFYTINKLFSHQETGIAITYERDKTVQQFCKKNEIEWLEFPSNGVIRGLKDRENWSKKWTQTMRKAIYTVNLKKIKPFYLANEIVEEFDNQAFIEKYKQTDDIFKPDLIYQQAGEVKAWELLEEFVHERAKNYTKHISKPLESRHSCSRLSAHLAYGNISIRQMYQYLKKNTSKVSHKKALNNFVSRLAWHCHFIQKFEMEESIEFQNQNRAFNGIRIKRNKRYFLAWKNGKTGYPLVDACMRCVRETGYLNFRMRAMVVSFLTHHLWLGWREGAAYLAQQFLDFEAGIHYAQFQMQAACTGINTVRVYNPVKQARDHDPTGAFVKQWLPALKDVPAPLCHAPFLMSPMEEQWYNCVIGEDYPHPIVNLEQSHRRAVRELNRLKNTSIAKEEAAKILAKHVEKPKARRL